MGDWKSDGEVRSAADRAARRLIDLYNHEQPGGKWLGSPEAYPGGGGAVVLRGLLEDADIVLSLDPQKIIDEYERMQKVGRALNKEASAEIIDAFRTIDRSIDDWDGDGARAFQRQISMIEAFIGQQKNYLARTVESLALVLAASVRARRDYVALANATSAAVAKALKQHQEADTKIMISVGASVVTAIMGLAAGGVWLTTMAGVVIGASSAELQLAVDGDKFAEVAGGYAAGRDQVHAAYKDVVRDAMAKIQGAERNLLDEANELFAPIPSTIDVNSPAFGYQKFAAVEDALKKFGPKVDEEHRKLLNGHKPAGIVNPDSPIRRRLDG